MKRKIFAFIIVFQILGSFVFGQQKIGECNKNVIDVGFINDTVPVAVFYDTTQGLISEVKKFYVQIGKEIYGPFDSILSWAYGTNTFYYTVEIDDEYYFCKNKTMAGPYSDINTFYVSKDEKVETYSYSKDNMDYIKNGLKTIGPFEELNYWLACDDKVIAYAYKENSKSYIFSNNKKYGPFDNVEGWKYTFISENNVMRYSFVVDKDNQQYIFNDEGVLTGPFDIIYLDCYSHDGKLLAYRTVKKQDNLYKYTLWVNDKRIEESPYISDVFFSNDNRPAYLSESTNVSKYKLISKYIHFKNNCYGPFDFIYNFSWSEDGKYISFIGKNYYENSVENYIYVGNEKSKPFKDSLVENLTLSKDYKHIAYVLDDEKKYLVIDGKKNLITNSVFYGIWVMKFSDDGKELAYVVEEDYEKYWVCKSNFKSKQYDRIDEIWYSNNILHFVGGLDGINNYMIVLENKEYIGRYLKDSLVYIKNGKIYKK